MISESQLILEFRDRGTLPALAELLRDLGYDRAANEIWRFNFSRADTWRAREEPAEPETAQPDAPAIVETVPERRDGPVVYFIQAMSGGPIKIGYTKNISQRLATAQTHSPERLIVIASFAGGAAEEGALHWKLKAHRVGGEWYAPAPEVLAEVERITASA